MTAARWTQAAFVAAGIAFLLFPVVRPWPDETTATAELAAAFASDRWVLAHLCGILGLGLLAPALLGLRAALAPAGTAVTTWAVGTAWAGAGSRAWVRWAGVPLALGLLLLLPQFFGGPEVRIAHGVLVAAGCVLLAAAVRPPVVADGGTRP